MRKGLAFLLMVLAVMVVFVSCDDSTNDVTDTGVVTEVASLKAAISEDVINTIGNDITDLSESLSIKKSIVIDIAGHNITANSADTYKSGNLFYIFKITKSKVTLEIKNSSMTESVISKAGAGISSGLCIADNLTNV